MDKFLAGLILLTVCFSALIIGAFYLEWQRRQELPLVSLSELTKNKAAYEGKTIKVEGVLVKELDTEVRSWFIMVMLPLSTGKTTTLVPVLIPVTDRYHIYQLSSEGCSIAIAVSEDCSNLLGKHVTVVGEVDGVKNADGQTFDYMLRATIIH
ncbi:MAG TPA: hypothetical protein ENG66_01735 [Thermococcus sp.]|nr:hypothetical protein [Thermococcus sp.]